MELEPSILEEIRRLEEELLLPNVRKSKQDLALLLADDFLEFGCSGSVYDKRQIIEALQEESADELSLTGFQARALASDVVLTTYRSMRRSIQTKEVRYSLRSSIWKLSDGRWRMAFHQGTISTLET